MNKKGIAMQEQLTVLQQIKQFIQAFSEFLGRPKTIFDIKDRARLLLLLALVIGVLEGAIYYLQK
jgi:hypothetical protein